MCLALPAKVLGITGETGTVELGGVEIDISLALLDDVQPGDYVVVHVGFALSKIDEAEARATLAALHAARQATAPPPPRHRNGGEEAAG